MSGRKTTLTFDDYSSEAFEIVSGINQGCPLSVILYLFYNSALVDISLLGHALDGTGYIDDIAFLATGKTIEVAHEHLCSAMSDSETGAFWWSETHHSEYAIEKLGLVNYMRPKANMIGPILNLPGGMHIPPSEAQVFLGMALDRKLKFHAQADHAYVKGMKWVQLFKRMSQGTRGLTAKLARKLYTSMAIPAMLYVADVYITPIQTDNDTTHTRQRGSVGIIRKLEKVHVSHAYTATCGAMMER